jgi:hypothetical protein
VSGTSITERALQSVTCVTPERVDPETGEITVVARSNPRRFRNGCCSARHLCPRHGAIALHYRQKRRAVMEKLGRTPYAFEDNRANDLIALVHDLHGPVLPSTPGVYAQVFAIANYLTGEPYRLKEWLTEAAPWYAEDEVDELLERLNARKPYRYTSAKLAHLFDVTWERKQRLGIETIAAPDTPADIIAAAKARRRESNRKYSHDQRRRLGKPTRAQYLASIKGKEPWVAEDISRATYYRRRRLGQSKTHSETGYVDTSTSSSTGVHSPSLTSSREPAVRPHHARKANAGVRRQKESAERRDRSDGTPRRQRRASRTDDHVRKANAGAEAQRLSPSPTSRPRLLLGRQKESAEGKLRFAAKPSSSLQRSSYGQSAKFEFEQASRGKSSRGDGVGASVSSGVWFSTLGMGSSAVDSSQIWPLVSGSARAASERASLGPAGAVAIMLEAKG